MPKLEEKSPLFLAAVQVVLDDEGRGKITNDPDDPGGRTKFGITQRLLDQCGYILPRKVDDLVEADAIEIYHRAFWLEYNFSSIMEPYIATKAFNFCVNAGPRAAFLCLQRAMCSCGVKVKEDGVLGPITRGLLNDLTNGTDACGARAMQAAYRSELAGYYRDLDQPKFEAGWIARSRR